MDLKKKEKLKSFIIEKAYKKGDFILASGKHSSYYFNLKNVMCDPEGARVIAELMMEVIMEHKLQPTAIGGMELGALPLIFHLQAYATDQKFPMNAFIVRKQIKDHGTKSRLEGIIHQKSKVIILDDTITTGGSSVQSIDVVRSETESEVLAVIAVLDREEGAQKTFQELSIPFFSLIQFHELGIN